MKTRNPADETTRIQIPDLRAGLHQVVLPWFYTHPDEMNLSRLLLTINSKGLSDKPDDFKRHTS